MSEPMIGEIRFFPYAFVPYGWLLCDGSSQSITTYQVLYGVIGTTYGGNGSSTFNLPMLLDPTDPYSTTKGRAVLGPGAVNGGGTTNYQIGQQYGTANASLTAAQIPAHNHSLSRKSPVTPATAKVSTPGAAMDIGVLTEGTTNCHMGTKNPPTTTLHQNTIGIYGAGTPHENRQPFLTLRPFIAYEGVFPVRP